MKIFLLFFLFSNFLFAADFHVVIDPGHGGSDLGAVRDSFVESKIVLQIAEKVKATLTALSTSEKKIVVTLTREKDDTLSLKDRVALANDAGADLFVSLHANTSTSRSITGMEFYFNSPINPHKDKETFNSKNLSSNEVVAKIKDDFQFYDKTEKSLFLTKAFREKSAENVQKAVIKRAPFYVVERTSMPSVLVELGFISNRREARKLISEDYQNEMARLLSAAIIEYKEKSDKTQAL
jgi:N-acetylmuramoyl-L-alanine amidase